MAIPFFLAMTWEELSACGQLPEHLGFMACHFSPTNKGLSNFPAILPPGHMLIIDDQDPPDGHDPALIARQVSEFVERFRCRSVLLDLQRPGMPQTAAIVQAIVANCPVPVGVSELYAKGLPCPVFLPPLPPHIPLAEHLAPWHGREVWLDMSPTPTRIRVTRQGSEVISLPSVDQPCHPDAGLNCHYRIHLSQDEVCFDLIRTPDDLSALLQTAKAHGITCAVGLYQELKTSL